MNIRTRLTFGLVSLIGLFSVTGAIFYNRIQHLDRTTHTLQALIDNTRQQNVNQLTLDFQVLNALNAVLATLNTQGSMPNERRLSTQLEDFENRQAALLQALQGDNPSSIESDTGHDHNHDDHSSEQHSNEQQTDEASSEAVDKADHHEHDHGHDHEPGALDIPTNPDLEETLANSIGPLETSAIAFSETVNDAIAATAAGNTDEFEDHRLEAIRQAETVRTNLLSVVEALEAQAMYANDQMAGFVTLFDSSIHEFLRLFLISVLGAVALSGGVSFWLFKNIAHPLEQLKKSSNQIRSGNWEPTPVINADDEIGQTAIAFNHMVNRLQRSFTLLNEQISDLETSEIELRTAKEFADQANLAKSTFLANMSHELRTPLNAIIGYSEMLQEEAEDLEEEAFVPDLVKIHGAGKHLLGLINDILDISKIEAGRMELYLETFDINSLLQDVVATIKPLIDKNQNTLATDYPSDLGSIHADITKLRQNLFNLLSNASKFTQTGIITLRVSTTQFSTEQTEEAPSSAEDWIIFEVEDTGIGMSPSQVEKVFQPFSQADASTTRKYGGTGLGLTITQKFCQMMGGEITVKSVEGQGSTFTMVLPRQLAQTEPEDALTDEANNDDPMDHKGNGSILVIDDDDSIGDFLERSLSRYGYDVQVATTGAEGLEMAKTLRPSAITLDVMMPGMDGWAVLTSLKSDPATASIPVVMLTIISDQDMGYALGASDYLLKPVNRDQLLLTLHRFRNEENGSSILIVDDSTMNREVLRRQIETANWSVEEAHHGLQALDLIKIHPPNLILLDLMMPEMDGFQFLETLRQNPDWKTIPVVVVTAKDLTEADRQRLNGHVEHIYHKGDYDRQTLINELRRLLPRVNPVKTSSTQTPS